MEEMAQLFEEPAGFRKPPLAPTTHTFTREPECIVEGDLISCWYNAGKIYLLCRGRNSKVFGDYLDRSSSFMGTLSLERRRLLGSVL